MRYLLYLLLVFVTWVVAQELTEDRKELAVLEKEVKKLREALKKAPTEEKLIDELNSLGYPIYFIYDKYNYLKERGKEYEEVYNYARDVYEEYLLLKREIFPHFIMEEAKRNNLPVCSVELRGKEKREIVVRIKNPESEEEIRRVLENTQLLYADRIGFEVVDFRYCKD